MTPYKEIGECLISYGDEDYFFRPSFAAMSRIGDPREIVQTFYDLHNDDVSPKIQALVDNYQSIPEHQRRFYAAYTGIDSAPAAAIKSLSSSAFAKPAVMAAMTVLRACCDRDPAPLIGEVKPSKSGKWGFVYRRGGMELLDMILVAQSLITHGIIGKAKIRKLQRHESDDKTTEFKAIEYINSARNHFAMSRSEAEQLTMTEFVMLIAQKYPDQKGYTREEYDNAADDFFARRKRRMAKKANQASTPIS